MSLDMSAEEFRDLSRAVAQLNFASPSRRGERQGGRLAAASEREAARGTSARVF